MSDLTNLSQYYTPPSFDVTGSSAPTNGFSSQFSFGIDPAPAGFDSLPTFNPPSAASPTPFFSMDNLIGHLDTDSGKWVGGQVGLGALNLAKGLWDTYSGFKNSKTLEENLAFQKDAFSKQFNMQKDMINNAYRDREAARRRVDSSYRPAASDAPKFL